MPIKHIPLLLLILIATLIAVGFSFGIPQEEHYIPAFIPPHIQLAAVSDFDTNLVGHWKFEDGSGQTASDSSGNNNTGTFVGNPTWTTGKLGEALDFDGVDDAVQMGDVIDFASSDDFTITGWFNRGTFNTDDVIIAKKNAAGRTRGYMVYIANSGDDLVLNVGDNTDKYTVTSKNTSFTTTGWHHFAAVWNENSAAGTELYIDGVDNNAADSGIISSIGTLGTSYSLTIGAESDAGNPFDGLIDDVRIYNRVLTASEILELYTYTGSGGGQTCGNSIVEGTEECDEGASNGACPTTCSATCSINTCGGDTTPPTDPTNLQATALSSSQIHLTWSASTDPVVTGQTTSRVTGYRIYRNGTQITTTANTSYSNTGLSPSTTYTYIVSAYDAAENESGQSTPSSATTSDTGGNTYSCVPNDIPIIVDRGSIALGTTYPMGAGIPLKQGVAYNTSSLGIASVSQGFVPAQFETRTTWPDGSIQWLWTDFQAPVENNFYLDTQGASNPLPALGVSATQTGNTINIQNEQLSITWDTSKGATPVDVKLNSGTVATGDGLGVYLIDQNSQRATLGGANANLNFTIETSNKIRAVLRVEGFYTTSSGEQMARSVIRYHIYWNQPWMKVDHSFIVTRDNTDVWYKEVGIDFPLDPQTGMQATFGRKNKSSFSTSIAGAGDQAYILQSTYPHLYMHDFRYEIGKGSVIQDTGAEASGWAALDTSSYGLMVAVKEFAPQFPKELSVEEDKVTAKLWSSRSGWELDYNTSTLIDKYWTQWWVDRVDFSWKATGLTPSSIRSYNPSPVGAARTHELFVGYYGGAGKRSETQLSVEIFEKPPIASAHPRYLTHVGPEIIWPMLAEGEGGSKYDDMERFISTWHDEQLVSTDLQVWPYTSWYDWGKLGNNIYRRDNHFNPDRIWAEWRRLNVDLPYNVTKYIWFAWIRSGDRKLLETAQRSSRFLADMRVVHSAGSSGVKNLGGLTFCANFDMPTPWCGNGIYRTPRSGEPVSSFIFGYFLRDNRWSKDTLDLMEENFKTNFQAEYNSLKCDPFMPLSMLTHLYKFNHDPEIASIAQDSFALLTDPQNTNSGINENYFATNCSGRNIPQERPTYKIARKGMAILEYYDQFGGDDARKVAEYAVGYTCRARNDTFPPTGYQTYYGALCGRINEWKGDQESFITTSHQINASRAVFAEYEKLPASDKGVSWWYKATCAGNCWTSPNWAHRFSNIIFGSKEGEIRFEAKSNGGPLFAVPTAMWALEGFPDGSNWNSCTDITIIITLRGDLNGDRTVNSFDWGIMNTAWGTADQTADLNNDGIVNTLDWSIMNSEWGRSS